MSFKKYDKGVNHPPSFKRMIIMSYKQSADYLKDKVLPDTKIAIVIGSGLSSIIDNIEGKQVISYADIPGFVKSTAPTHKGEMVIGELFGQPIICMNGRVHFYEGYDMSEITNYIKTLKLLGVETLILTNASGSMKQELEPGSLVVIEDHLNLSGHNPLIGTNDDAMGPRFVDMSNAYSKELIEKVMAGNEDVLTKGTYVFTTGPSFETPAEIRAYRMLGGDIVGMSTVPEAIMGAFCGLNTLAISCVSNYGTGIPGSNVSDEELVRVTGLSQKRFVRVIQQLFEKI